MIHIATKLRNSLVGNRELILGEEEITTETLEKILSQKGEAEIGYRESDLDPHDKMNFPAVERLCAEKVEMAVVEKGDHALALFLKLIRYSTYSLYSTKLKLVERIRQGAYAALFALTWRETNLAKNRLTSNQLLCICLNFVNLVGLCSVFGRHFTHLPLQSDLLGSQQNELWITFSVFFRNSILLVFRKQQTGCRNLRILLFV
jgi:hypothetical protein